MSARDREHDEWIPWYLEDTVGWLELSLAARGAGAEVARKMGRKSGGSIALPRGLASLAVLLRLRWAGELEPALAELIEQGRLTWDGAVLHDPGWAARQRRSSADRMRAKRARDVDPNVTSRASHPVTPRHTASPSVSDSGSGSDLGSDPASELPTGVRTKPIDPGGPPEWFLTAISVVAMGTGVTLPAPEAWLRYEGHRAGKGIAPTGKDAQYWLTTVMVPEAREVLRRGARDRDRDEAFRRDKLGVAPKAQDSRKTFRERDDWAATAGPPDPEAAAMLARLMGKVGT